MKIGILTQPLHNNYGGLLQAFALQTVLEREGHEVRVIKRLPEKRSLIKRIDLIIRRLFRWVLHPKKSIENYLSRRSKYIDRELIAQNTSYFIRKYINITDPITDTKALKIEALDGYDAFIVGSDQVWRLHYSPHMPNYFLDFTKDMPGIKRVAFAASFGLDYWHFPQSLTNKCKKLIQQFDAVSVREDSAVNLCRDYLGVEAEHVVDPTLLLSRQDYLDLIAKENEPQSEGDLYYYILDMNDEKRSFITRCAEELGLKPFTVMPDKGCLRAESNDSSSYIYPPVTKWIKGFVDSKFVITDSYHGCIFSVLFNVPVVVIGNPERGMARFESLLRTFDSLSKLFISGELPSSAKIYEPINWQEINNRIAEEKKRAIEFLNTNLIKK